MTLFLLKLTLLLLLGVAVAALLQGRSAATRHFAWALTLAGALALAAAAYVAPAVPIVVWEKVITPGNAGVLAGWSAGVPAGEGDGGGETPPAQPPGRRRSPIASIWLLGFSALAIRFIAGRAGVARIVRNGTLLDCDELAEAQQRMNVARAIRVVTSSAVTAPFTAGTLHPVILLPADAHEWPAERRRAALMHELAHIARHDYLIHSFAALACALYWFHPVAWIAVRALRRESEQATDDLVIARGMHARDYAAQLLDVARAARAYGANGLLALGMACPSHFETRLRALLDETRRRGVLSRGGALLASILVALIVVPLAAARPEIRERVIAKPDYQKTLDAEPGGTLVLDLETGASVDISGTGTSRVDIRGQLRGRDAYRTVVDATARGNEVRLSSKIEPEGDSSSTSHAFVIQVPDRFNVKLHSAGGDVNIRDVRGTFKGETGGGSITLRRLEGEAHLSTGGGEVTVTDSTLDGEVTTGGGGVNVVRVKGNFNGLSGGTSDADESNERDEDREDISGVVRIRKDGGLVDVDEAPHGAVITTGGGRITVGEAKGLVVANTGGGRIIVGPVAGSVRAHTGAGQVQIELVDAGGEAQNVDVVTGNGHVRIVLPASYDGRFEIETAYTESHDPVRIESDFDLQYEPVTDWSARQGTPRRYVRASGRAGSGKGLVRVRAVNGNVAVTRN